MGRAEQRVIDAAARQKYLITRAEVFELGGSDRMINVRLRRGRWMSIHPGVYQVDTRPLNWHAKLLAAVFACGPGVGCIA